MTPLQLSHHAVIGLELALAWADGVEHFLPLEMLRRACPCAACQGEPDAMGRVVKPPTSYGEKSFEMVNLETVGGYALRPYWADGHQTGMFSYEYLRQLGEAVK